MQGDVEQTTLNYIIRDHDRDKFENRKKEIQHLVNKINAEFGEGTATLEMRDQYYNMREKIEPVMHIIDVAFAAMEAVGVKPNVKPIRGGTDGAQAFHSKGYLVPIFLPVGSTSRSLRICTYSEHGKGYEGIVKIAEMVASDK